MSAVSEATMPQEFQVQIPKDGKTATAYIFYAANLLPAKVRFEVPDYKHGGIIKPDVLTLKHCKGYIRQCEITEMQQHMHSTARTFIRPEDRKHMTKVYNVVDKGVVKQIGADDNLLRTPFYPQDEIDQLTGQGDGIVRMPVTSRADRDRAQAFLFPQGIDVLPTRMVDIKKQLQERLDAAIATGDKFFIDVCNAAILSCDQFDSWGRQLINEQNGMYAMAQTKGWPWGYGPEAELCFEQLGVQRKDNVQQEQANKMDALIEAQTKQAEAMAKQMEAQAEAIAAARQPQQPKKSPTAAAVEAEVIKE